MRGHAILLGIFFSIVYKNEKKIYLYMINGGNFVFGIFPVQITVEESKLSGSHPLSLSINDWSLVAKQTHKTATFLRPLRYYAIYLQSGAVATAAYYGSSGCVVGARGTNTTDIDSTEAITSTNERRINSIR